MRLAIIIPAYNEEKTIAQVIKTLPRKFPHINYREIIVINDGSQDKTEAIAQKMPVTVISHYLNRGLGAALGTGFEYVRRGKFDCLVTFDADGQHNPNDIWSVIKPIINKKADIVIGSRLKTASKKTNPRRHARLASKALRVGMPWYRIIGIWGLNIFTLVFYWVWTTDSQSGLRAFSSRAIEKIKIISNKMEVSSEFFNEIQKHNLKLIEVPITPIYTSYSLTKGQKNSNGFKILSRIIYRRFIAK